MKKKILSILILLFLFSYCQKTKSSKLEENILPLSYLYFSSSAPAMIPSPGYYETLQKIRLEHGIPGSTIYYSTDGSEPNSESKVYTKPFPIWWLAGVELKAKAVSPQGTWSDTASGIYSYRELKTGQTVSYSAYDDGYYKKGVERNYIFPSNSVEHSNSFLTTDESTGVIWKTCSQYDASLDGPGCSSALMNWSDAQTGPGGCDSLNKFNSGKGYFGLTTWRLPTFEELISIIDYGATSGAKINLSAFPNSSPSASGYWTSSLHETVAWYIDFSIPLIQYSPPSILRYARCVAGEKPVRKFNGEDLGNGIIRDRKTGLYWQKCAEGDNPITCEGPSAVNYNFAGGLNYCENLTLGGRKWRLPNINELYSLILPSSSAIDRTFFLNFNSAEVHSSTTNPSATTEEIITTFDDYTTSSRNKISQQADTRCVSDP